jgi:hypothetical protein
MKTTRYSATTELTEHALNDSKIAVATKAAFDAHGYSNPHRAVYLDAIREVRSFRTSSAEMLRMVAEREVGRCVESARAAGLANGPHGVAA